MIKKRFGLVMFGVIGIIENLVNLLMYLTFLDLLVGAVDCQMPNYFWYSNKFLKGGYLKDIGHGKDI